jgi:major vault protein
VNVPPGEAVLVTGTQTREVVRGPAVRVLAFDESLETLELSTGTPKSTDVLLSTCFLRVEGNKVSDRVQVRTADHVELEVKVSYRVSFVRREGVDDARWFSVPNYVGLLCDHLGSIVRAAVRQVPIERFHAASAEILRTAVLGEKRGDKRTGREFEENGLLVYDVEVLDVSILDEAVETLLTDAQRTAITAEVARKREHLRLQTEETREQVARAVSAAQRETLVAEVEVELARRALSVTKVEAKAEATRLEALGKARAEAEALSVTSSAQSAAFERRVAVERQQLEAQAAAFKEQMAALHPELVSTLKTLGHQHFAASLTANLSPLAILGGESVADVAGRLLAKLPLSLPRVPESD